MYYSEVQRTISLRLRQNDVLDTVVGNLLRREVREHKEQFKSKAKSKYINRTIMQSKDTEASHKTHREKKWQRMQGRYSGNHIR